MIYLSPVTAQTWTDILPTIRKRFPEVPQLTTTALAEWLGSTQRPPPVLVDVRSDAEYAVSHLAGARHATNVSQIEALGLGPEVSVVLYCSVGYRSSDPGVKLLRRPGWAGRVFNLEGSLFAWANEGRPIHRGTQRVTVVHPYDRRWGVLLDSRWHPAPQGVGSDR